MQNNPPVVPRPRWDLSLSVISDKPSRVTITPRRPGPHRFSIPETRELAVHLLKVCDLVDDAETELTRRVEAQKTSPHGDGI